MATVTRVAGNVSFHALHDNGRPEYGPGRQGVALPLATPVSVPDDKLYHLQSLIDAGDVTLNASGTDEQVSQNEVRDRVLQTSVAGALPGLIPLAATPITGVISVLAIVTATGAPDTPMLLALGTDYDATGYANGDLNMLTDQTGNTLLVTFRTLG